MKVYCIFQGCQDEYEGYENLVSIYENEIKARQMCEQMVTFFNTNRHHFYLMKEATLYRVNFWTNGRGDFIEIREEEVL